MPTNQYQQMLQQAQKQVQNQGTVQSPTHANQLQMQQQLQSSQFQGQQSMGTTSTGVQNLPNMNYQAGSQPPLQLLSNQGDTGISAPPPPPNMDAQQWYYQLMDAKRVDQQAGISDARRNQAHVQSNAARDALRELGIDTSTGAWGKGSTLQGSIEDYNRMYNPGGIDYDAAQPYFQAILNAMSVDQRSGNRDAINQAHGLSNEARQALLRLGIDTTTGDWAKGTSYDQAKAAYDAIYAQQQEDEFNQESNLIDDLSKKYGFDYSREYAATQAEAIAQAKRDAVAEGRKGVESGVMGAAEGLDRNYFNQYMMQAQDQTNRGLNAGIAADQNLRLAMSRQAEMGDVYRDANLRSFELDNMEGRIDQERIAYEDSLYNERLQQGFENVQTERGFQLSEGELTGRYVPEGVDQEEAFGLVQDLIGLKNKSSSGQLKTSYDYALNRAQADEIRSRLAAMGADVSLLGSDAQPADIMANLGNLFNTGQMRDSQAERSQSQSQWDDKMKQDNDHFMKQLEQDDKHFNKQMDLEWDKLDQDMKQFLSSMEWDKQKWNTMSAEQKESFKLAREQLSFEKSRFKTEQDWREYTFKNLSEEQKRQFELNRQQFGDTMAWQMHEFDATMAMADGYNSTMGGGGYGGF